DMGNFKEVKISRDSVRKHVKRKPRVRKKKEHIEKNEPTPIMISDSRSSHLLVMLEPRINAAHAMTQIVRAIFISLSIPLAVSMV
ncbi:MAG: hypothetical protein ACN2B6_00530, partial [Rickettsiales bacterium]